MRIHSPGLGIVHLVARCKRMFSNCRGQHIPLSLCCTMLSAAPGTVQSGQRNTAGTGHKGWCKLLPFSAILDRVLRVDQLLPECPKRTESDPDVQVAEHSADGLEQPVDVWDGYGRSCCLSLILVCLGESEPLHKSRLVTILLQCFLQLLLFLGSTYT